MAENEQNRPDSYYVSQHEPEAKPPPALESGIIKWLRENLFNSILNTILTILGILIIYFSVTGLSTWVVQDANWFSVSANFRNFMLGRYNADFEWRASLTLFLAVFAMGAAVAVWIRQIARTVLISIVAIVLIVQVLPPIVNATTELPSWYAGAGNIEISVAQTTEVAFDEIGFIGEEGDEINISLASEDVADEQALADTKGFLDNVANLLRNLSRNRLEDIATIEEFQSLVDQHEAALEVGDVPVITQAQYETYLAEIESTEIGESILEAYNINQIPVLVEIINADTLEVVASTTLMSSDDALETVLPVSGWYILRKELVVVDESAEGMALLNVQGIYPSAKRESTQATAFTRRPDGFSLEGENISEPVLDGEELPFIDIIRNQYRGQRSLEHYLRTYVSPFFSDIANYVSLVFLVGIAGYIVAEFLRMQWSMELAGRFATYALGSIPVILWVLINGMYLYSVMMWLVFVAMALACYLIYKMTQRDGVSSTTIVIGIVAFVVAAGIVLIADGFDLFRLLTLLPLVVDDAAVPRFLIWAGAIFIPLAIYLGKQAHIPGEEVKINIPLIGGIAVILFAVAGGLILTETVTIDTEWALQPSDARNWGGLLLTVMLTVYGIIVAFPIGIALALGRRSDLPLIKYLCTAYIELVRGSPFITVLFFMQLFIPLINPEFNQVAGSYRAIVATIAFSAAYLAENIRGGLQSLPPGQEEAAKALGLNGWQTISLITMPQALRAVIPALVGQFISLYKDTTLVAIVGLIDLVGFVNGMVVQPEFIGTRLEGLLFISILFFVVSYVMSYVSRLLEASGSGSTRRM